MNCLFCKIVKGEIPSNRVFENENVIAFRDIKPLAKEHILFIHKNHSDNFIEMSVNDASEMTAAIQEFLKGNKSFIKGSRLVTNIGDYGGQSVHHTHFHLLGGERLAGFGA